MNINILRRGVVYIKENPKYFWGAAQILFKESAQAPRAKTLTEALVLARSPYQYERADFWSLEYPYRIPATDFVVDKLDALADTHCKSGWAMEFDDDFLHYRFADEEERGVFILWAFAEGHT